MENKFKVYEEYIVLGLLQPYYPVSCLAYAFDVPEEKIRDVLDWYHQGNRRAFLDIIWNMMHEQDLSEENVWEIFSYLDLKAVVEEAIKEAKDGKQKNPDFGGSEVFAEAFKAGYVYTSTVLMHELKNRAKSSIEEINDLFSVNPVVKKWIGFMSHRSDQLEIQYKIFGKPCKEKAFEILIEYFGPEVAARLKENEPTARLNRSISELPEEVGTKLAIIINNIIAPLSKSGVDYRVVEEAAFRALVAEDLIPKDISLEKFRQIVKGEVKLDDSGVDYGAEYRKQTGEDMNTGVDMDQ